MGCMVGPKDDDLRKRFPYVDHFARPQAFEGIFETLGLTDDTGGEFWPTSFADAHRPHRLRADHPRLRQVLHLLHRALTAAAARPAARCDEIVEEVAHLVHGGVREVTLLGQTVEAYGLDLDGQRPTSATSWSALHDLPNLQRIRFLTSYPKDMTPKIIEAVRDLPKVCEFFNIPVQPAPTPSSTACAAATRSPSTARRSTSSAR